MIRHVRLVSVYVLLTLMAMAVSGVVAWAQQLETHEDRDGWKETRLDESQVVRWRIIGEGEVCGGSMAAEDVVGGLLRIEVSLPETGNVQSGVSLGLGPCRCDFEIEGVYRHRGTAVAVVSSTNAYTDNQGMNETNRCFFAVRLSRSPEVLFQRHLSSFMSSSGWWVPSNPVGYRFVPMNDLLLVVMDGTDGAVVWPVGDKPASQSPLIATTIPRWANEIATMPEGVRSRFAPVGMVGQSVWAALEEPFTYPPRRIVLGERAVGRGTFSAELSYDGPRLDLETIHGVDDDVQDPLPGSDFPLADYRWEERDFGPQVQQGEVDTLTYGPGGELYRIRWPCTVDPYDWDRMEGYELPASEEWLVLVGPDGPAGVDVRTHLVTTCLTFQVSPFFYGRGGLFRSFENGTVEEVIENGRTVGVEIHHSRPRILRPSGASPLPDLRGTFEEHWPRSDWWRPLFDQDAKGAVVVYRVDGGGESENP